VELRDPHDGAAIDRVVATWYRGPASYTGEDVVELSCHGGSLIPALVLDACVRAGARVAEAGEFTRRAYLHGKMDLVQAEAVADLIEARSRALHRAALGQLERGLSSRVASLRERLIGLEALLVHHLDFPEEDDPPVSSERIAEHAATLVGEMDELLATAPEGELLREGALTVFAGRPNAGKSSLYNALLGEDRAIVTEEAGTTRDALEASVQLGGFPFRLVDTAGLRESGDRIEMLGIEVARRYVDRADLILLCVPADEGMTGTERSFLDSVGTTPVVLVTTKVDLTAGSVAEGVDAGDASDTGEGGAESAGLFAGCVRVSALSGEGFPRLRELLPGLVYASVVRGGTDAPVLTRRRQARGLATARDEVAAFRRAMLDGLPAEVAASHLRPAETALEELLGVVSVDDVLDVVFKEFCVGK
jgi:tRNA modification GTPase